MLTCRSCGTSLPPPFLDLGDQPLSNAYLSIEELTAGQERTYPLRVRVCPRCILVQVDDAVPAHTIFNETYAYFSSYSESWLDHSRRFAHMAIQQFGLTSTSQVVEIASNDGYLLQFFAAAGIPVLGIEPSANAATVARGRGISTDIMFFGEAAGRALAAKGVSADLIHAANVLAHVPDLNDFVAGFSLILKPGGTISFEFPHLLELMRQVQFDTIYHEHYSYLSLGAVERALERHGLAVRDLELLPTHGGSLRLFCQRREEAHGPSPAVEAVRAAERAAGLDRSETYSTLAVRVDRVKANFLSFLARARREGRRVAAYGAAAKGNTFLNTCAASAADIVCAFDRSPHKQGRLLPGSHIPVVAPDQIATIRPDYLLILPWNIKDEIREQLAFIAAWGGRFVTAIPDVTVFDP